MSVRFRVSRIGRSVEGRPIQLYASGESMSPRIVVLAGMHGDEPKSVSIARLFIERLQADELAGDTASWAIVPIVNPDGYQRRKRRNARGVDINRNFPTHNWCHASPRGRMYGGGKPASEPETRAVIRLIDRLHPARIVTIHSIGRGRFCNNYDGPARSEAQRMHRCNGYPVTKSIGYPTPGSFGTWVGGERKIPTITLELPSHHSAKRCWADNLWALLSLAEAL